MNATKILSQSKAEAVYSAMCALNNIAIEMKSTFNSHGELVFVSAMTDGRVRVELVGITDEIYPNQAAFATAYGLSQG